NLLLPNGGTVEIVDAPSYNAINATIGSGFSCAQNVRLTRGNYLAFVTDVCKDTVTAVKYKTGANVIVLGTAYGISQPFAAVEQPNAVY
ncbi:MAG: hypothetical protein JO030_04550, partial [Candidatus Eremiobacteraeota bacterium]|nr:hypothetical protein [Candidatus Eremiobacteraeota bacterium]